MSAAVFVLAINIFLCLIFATAFAVVGFYARLATGARWLTFAYLVCLISPALEFVLPFISFTYPVELGIFAGFLLTITLCLIGLCRHYQMPVPARSLAAVIGVSLAANAYMLTFERDFFLRNLTYQAPYAALLLIGAMLMLRMERRKGLENAMLVMFFAGAINFLSKPFIAELLGNGLTASDYIFSNYAAISQSLGALLLISTGILTVLVFVRDGMAEMILRSETDVLSGLYNRRGFDQNVDQLLATSDISLHQSSLIVADIDHFKSINDNFGHDVGDHVIRKFADILRKSAPEGAIVGRTGGEEFAIYLPDTSGAAAWDYAEKVRRSFSETALGNGNYSLHASASFGVCEMRVTDTLSDLFRNTDKALYAAKDGGRNQVVLSDREAPNAGAKNVVSIAS